MTIINPMTGEEIRLTYAASAEKDGRFGIRLPYPTDQPMSTAPGTITVKGPYLLEINDTPQELDVSEADIQSGKAINLTP